MALSDAEMILRGIQIANQRNERGQALSLEKQRLEAEKIAQQERHDLELKKFEQAQKEFELTRKAADAMHAIQIARQKQELSEKLLQGIPVPGEQATPIGEGPDGAQFSPINPNQATSIQHILPLNDEKGNPITVTLPTPQRYAEQQGQMNAAMQAPLWKHQSDLEAQREAARLKQVQEAKDEDYKRMFMQKVWDDARNKATVEAQNDREDKRLKMMRTLEGMKERAKNALPEGLDLNLYANQLYNGDKTTKQLMAEFPLMKQVPTAIVGAFNKAGGVPLTDAQQQALANYGQFGEIINKMDEYLNLAPKQEAGNILSSLAAQGRGMYSRMAQTPDIVKYNELQGRAAEIAKNVQGQKGSLSDRDIAIAMIGAGPTIGGGYTNNITKRDDFFKLVDEKFNHDFHNIPEAQRNALKAKIGLLEIAPKYNLRKQQATPSGQTPSNPQQPQSNTYNWTPQGFVRQ